MNQKLKDFIREQKALEFTCMDEGYDFLEEGDTWVQFVNENGSEDILLRIDDNGILLYFDEWNFSYNNDEEGIEQCIEECTSLFEDRSYLWKADFGGQSFVSLIRDEPGKFYEMARKGFKANFNGRMIEINPELVEQEFIFWDPAMMEPSASPYLN